MKMWFDSYEFKENLNTYLNPKTSWMVFVLDSETLLQKLMGGFMVTFLILVFWGLLPLTLLIIFLNSVKFKEILKWEK